MYNQKLHESPTRLSPEFSVCFTAEAEKANLGMGSPAGSSGKETQKDVQMSMERAAEPLLHASQGWLICFCSHSVANISSCTYILKPRNMNSFTNVLLSMQSHFKTMVAVNKKISFHVTLLHK